MIPGTAPIVSGAQPLALVYRGHGKTHGDPFDTVNARTLNYATVLGGSAPVAGSLVCWMCGLFIEYWEVGGSPNKFYRQAVGNGWVQTSNPTPLQNPAPGSIYTVSTMLAKVIEASDLSSPPQWCTVQTDATVDGHGFWIAYDVQGIISSLTIPFLGRGTPAGTSSAPGNVVVDSSALIAPAVAITMASSCGTDGSIQLSGITLDFEETQNNYSGYFDNTLDSRYGAKLDVGGAAYTLSKGADGSGNGLLGGYVAVS